MNKKKKKNGLSAAIPSLLIGVVFGYFIVWVLGNNFLKKSTLPQFLICMCLLFVVAFAIYFFGIIIHEGGHLLAGLLSGYKYIFFRVGNLTLAKQNGKFSFKKMGIPGTGGQCLMQPPAYNNGDFPCTVYLLGGIIANLIIGSITVIICYFLGFEHMWVRIITLFGVINILFFLLNGIPLRVGGIANDGYDVLSIYKHSEFTKRSLWCTLEYAAMSAQGKTCKEMPDVLALTNLEEAFSHMDDKTGPGIVSIGMNHMLLNEQYEDVIKLLDQLLECDDILALYEKEFAFEKWFFTILFMSNVTEQNKKTDEQPDKSKVKIDSIEQFLTKEMLAYIKQTESIIPSRARQLYGYYKLYKKDEAEAARYLSLFEKQTHTYPMTGELILEKQLIAKVDEIFQIQIKNKNN